MTDLEFLQLVARMRHHQRKYFRTKNWLEMQKSYQLESIVDNYISKALEGVPLTIESELQFNNE